MARGFVRKHEKVLVIEELAPEVEETVRQVAGCVPVFGKKNGYAPYEGELSPAGGCRDHGEGGIPAGKPVPSCRSCPEPAPAAPDPLRGLPPPRGVLCDKEGLQRRDLPERHRVLYPRPPARGGRYHHLHGCIDHGRERHCAFRREARRGLHDRGLHVPAYRHPGPPERGLQRREHDRRDPRQPDHGNDRPPAEPELRRRLPAVWRPRPYRSMPSAGPAGLRLSRRSIPTI